MSANRVETEQPFRLLDLPDELWSNIGKLAIDNEPFCQISDLRPNGPKHPDTPNSKPPQQPAITKTCNALRHELLPYYYNTKIHGRWNSGAKYATRAWLSSLGPENWREIRGIYTLKLKYIVYAAEVKEEMEEFFGVELAFGERLGLNEFRDGEVLQKVTVLLVGDRMYTEAGGVGVDSKV